MNPRDFQVFAESLTSGTQAAELRTAVSRAYYAVFHVGKEVLEGMSFQISRGSKGHADVQDYLINSGNPDTKRIGTQLANIYTMRLRADYELSREDIESQKTVQSLIQKTKEMIQTLELRCSGSERAQIIEAIQTWRGLISPPRRKL